MDWSRDYTEEEIDKLMEGVDEPPIAKKPTEAEIEEIFLVHSAFDVSISHLCNSLGVHRDKYYRTLKKAGVTAGTVDYIQLAERERRQPAKRVAVVSKPDEEW